MAPENIFSLGHLKTQLETEIDFLLWSWHHGFMDVIIYIIIKKKYNTTVVYLLLVLNMANQYLKDQ